MKKFWNDFKAFAMKGNVVDMAVGVVVGSAFSKIVSSFVADVITPLLGVLLGKISIADLKWVIKEAQVVSEAVLDEAGNVITPEVLSPEVAMTYGVFIQAIIDFFIIALSLFIVLRIMMKVKNGMNHKQIEAEAEAARIAAEKKAAEEAEAAAKAAEPSEELKALLEIRDLLKKQ